MLILSDSYIPIFVASVVSVDSDKGRTFYKIHSVRKYKININRNRLINVIYSDKICFNTKKS